MSDTSTTALEPYALANFHRWRLAQLAEIERRQKAMAEALQKLIPERDRDYFEHQRGVVDTLCQYGRSDDCHWDDEGDGYQKVRQRLGRLRKAWAHLIQIKSRVDGQGKLYITYTMIDPDDDVDYAAILRSRSR